MYELDSKIENHVYSYQQVKAILEKEGYALGGAWDYDHGYFDYKLANDGGYHFLRIPFQSERGEIEHDAAVIRMGKPYILTHRYQDDVDAYAESSVIQAAFNQFQAPTEKDGDIPSNYIEKGKVVLAKFGSVTCANFGLKMIENLFNPFRKRRNGFFILRQESIKSAEGQNPRNGKWAAGVVVKQFNYLMMDLNGKFLTFSHKD